jgi:hypothetical protein
MTHDIVVRLDSQNQWRAAFADAPRSEHSGDTPSAALWNLFADCQDRSVEPRTIVAIEPDSTKRLNFTVEGRIPIGRPAGVRGLPIMV